MAYSFLALGVVQTREQDLDESEHIEIVVQDFADFRRRAWSGEIALQALYLTALGFAEHFIARSNLPQLRAIQESLSLP